MAENSVEPEDELKLLSRPVVPSAARGVVRTFMALVDKHRGNIDGLVEVLRYFQLFVARGLDKEWDDELWEQMIALARTIQPHPTEAGRHYSRADGCSYNIAEIIGSKIKAQDVAIVNYTDKMRVLADLYRDPSIYSKMRHYIGQFALSRYVTGLDLNRCGENERMAHAGVVRCTSLVYSLPGEVLAAPKTTSCYDYTIFVAFDLNANVVCNSGCQYGPATTLVDHWFGEGGYMDRSRRQHGMPTLFRTLAYASQTAESEEQKTRADEAIVAAGLMTCQKSVHIYGEIRPLIAPELQEKIEMKVSGLRRARIFSYRSMHPSPHRG